VICTHHQWLTQLSCLSTAFSPELVKNYLPYCSRAVLAKAQLYKWVRQVTGRTWLVDVGDTNDLHELSPYSLPRGYAVTDIVSRAPTCLSQSSSARGGELFKHVLASCMFTSTVEHTGNAARPWEYSESLKSIIPLDSETAGYSLMGESIPYGNYFDKACFCRTFTIDWTREPCSNPENVDMTAERYWMYATCGRSALPEGLWKDQLMTTENYYIPVGEWHWPKCVADMPNEVFTLRDDSITNACKIDYYDYCIITPSVDQSSFCRNIKYESCGGSCHHFETRMDYVGWLFQLCRHLPNWHGLPENWYHTLAVPTPVEMIPWDWTVTRSNHSDISIPGSAKPIKSVPSTGWNVASLAFINIAPFFIVSFGRKTRTYQAVRESLHQSSSSNWFFTGLWTAAIQLFANWLNAVLVQSTRGYEQVPIVPLMFLWCSMPRLTWLSILLTGRQSFEAINLSTTASSVFAETIMQVFSSYYMMMTVDYGREHDFYNDGLELAYGEAAARTMYAGALMWLIVFVVALVQLLLLIRTIIKETEQGYANWLKWHENEQRSSNLNEEVVAQVNERVPLLADNATQRRCRGEGGTTGMDPKVELVHISPRVLAIPYAITVILMHSGSFGLDSLVLVQICMYLCMYSVELN
jgi:hypothetical protein